jgi:outer membrane lipoprotein SlyB
MRINPISISQYRPVKNQNVRRNTAETQNVNFKGGWGGGIGATIGGLAGFGLGTLLTLSTGGLAAPLLFSMGGCAAGSISGAGIEDKFKRSK